MLNRPRAPYIIRDSSINQTSFRSKGCGKIYNQLPYELIIRQPNGINRNSLGINQEKSNQEIRKGTFSWSNIPLSHEN